MRIKLEAENCYLVLPQSFEDVPWNWKGFYPEAELIVKGQHFLLNFYEPVRLKQTFDSDFGRVGLFFEENLVVVPEISVDTLTKAAEELVKDFYLKGLKPKS